MAFAADHHAVRTGSILFTGAFPTLGVGDLKNRILLAFCALVGWACGEETPLKPHGRTRTRREHEAPDAALLAAGSAGPNSRISFPDAGFPDATAVATNPFHAGDEWLGTLCGAALLEASIHVLAVTGNSMTAELEPSQGCSVGGPVPLRGTIDPETGRIAFRSTPVPITTLGTERLPPIEIVGTVDPTSRTYAGTVTPPGCEGFAFWPEAVRGDPRVDGSQRRPDLVPIRPD